METEEKRRHTSPLADLMAVAFIAITMFLLCRAIPPAQNPTQTDNCLNNGYRVSQAIQIYLMDYDNRLPLVTQGLGGLRPYIISESPDPTRCPVTGASYVVNSALSGTPVSGIGSPSSVVEFLRDRAPHPDGKRMVAYLDGHVDYGSGSLRSDTSCINRVRILTNALQMYVQDYDETLPSLNSASRLKWQLTPYLQGGGRELFQCPVTLRDYVWNGSYANQQRAAIERLDRAIIVTDAREHAPGKGKTVGFLDGHVRFDGQDTRDLEVLCADTVRRLNLGLLMYVQDYDETFPDFRNPSRLIVQLNPYLRRGPDEFRCPVTQAPYVWNAAFAYKSLATVANPATTFSVADRLAHQPGNGKTIGFLDGRLKFTGKNPYLPYPSHPDLAVQSYAKQVALALLMYTQDYDETLPPLTGNYNHFVRRLSPYVKQEDIFFCPPEQKPFILNQQVGGKPLVTFPNPTRTEVFRSPRLSGGRVVKAFLDGHTERSLP